MADGGSRIEDGGLRMAFDQVGNGGSTIEDGYSE
jgi:hypothetical protein